MQAIIPGQTKYVHDMKSGKIIKVITPFPPKRPPSPPGQGTKIKT